MSPDFCNHVVAMFAEPLLKYRNRDLYHVTCFHSSSKTDSQTERLQTLADEWVGVADKNTSEIASAIRQRSIDILVELSGLTAGCRMDVMVQKPAPVQCTCIGYPNTTGIAEIDYRITDAIADPPDTEQQFVETLLRLPKCFLCFTPPTQLPNVADPPCCKNKFVKHVTFGSFNNMSKLSDDTIALWSQVLVTCASARMVLKSNQFGATDICERTLKQFENHGVNRQRVTLLKFIDLPQGHLEAYSMMDIALDSFPYGGTTTTCDALLMGVPVITLRAPGATSIHAQNVGASLLTQANLLPWRGRVRKGKCEHASERMGAGREGKRQ
eukprot:Tamp_12195.p1 GENE.Tamp_12195~~Tamp_12195.p1  ORF type:complete len:327 (-),score=37.16 Tamp_12195:589-1569(-)